MKRFASIITTTVLSVALFGFAPAVIIGFLYTAARNWTGLPTPRGAHLAALAGVWLGHRLAHRVPVARLRQAICALLVVSGSVLVAKALG